MPSELQLPILRSTPHPHYGLHELEPDAAFSLERARWTTGHSATSIIVYAMIQNRSVAAMRGDVVFPASKVASGFLRVHSELHRFGDFEALFQDVEEGKRLLLAAIARAAPAYVQHKIAAARLEFRERVHREVKARLEHARAAVVHAEAELAAATAALAEERRST